MNKKLRKNLWGLQWIFLKQEKPQTRSSLKKSLNFTATDNSIINDLEDFPDISMLKLDDYDMPLIEVNAVSLNEKYKMSHIEDLPNLAYKNPHIKLVNPEDKKIDLKNQEKNEFKKTRHKSIQIRRVIFPAKVLARERKPESVNAASKRKNYGRWFLPPDKWRDSLEDFIKNN